MNWKYIFKSARMIAESLPYIACGLSFWASATLALVTIIGLRTCKDGIEASNFTIAFGITMWDVSNRSCLGFLLAVYLVPASFGLQLILMGIDTSGVTNSR
jgi:hypothetical protein